MPGAQVLNLNTVSWIERYKTARNLEQGGFGKAVCFTKAQTRVSVWLYLAVCLLLRLSVLTAAMFSCLLIALLAPGTLSCAYCCCAYGPFLGEAWLDLALNPQRPPYLYHSLSRSPLASLLVSPFCKNFHVHFTDSEFAGEVMNIQRNSPGKISISIAVRLKLEFALKKYPSTDLCGSRYMA